MEPEMLVRVQRGTTQMKVKLRQFNGRTHEVIGVVSVRVRYGEISPDRVSWVSRVIIKDDRRY